VQTDQQTSTQARRQSLSPGDKIAVVGSGISGLACAWLLAQRYHVTLFEAGAYFGGHSNTVDVNLENMTHPVDTGFLVHNELTYPNLIAMFEHLKVPVHSSDMSFGVSIRDIDLEWAGTNIGTVFAQKKNLLSPRFLKMLAQIMRFNKSAGAYLSASRQTQMTLGELLDAHHYDWPMRQWYLLPMAAAIWSSSVKDILGFPASTFLQFCLNHRLLQVEGRPKWRTVVGGSRVYVNAMLPQIQDSRLNCAVHHVTRLANGVEIRSERGIETFDAVVMACHAPTALRVLDARPDEARVLGAFRYQKNEAYLHVDRELLPKREKVWSAWNYLAAGDQARGLSQERPVAVTYLINLLQPLPFKTPVMVTLNPYEPPAADKLMRKIGYEHPVMDQAAIDAQRRLPDIQGQDRVWFCGAWCGYGFHEDGLKSALAVVRDFDVPIPWADSEHA